MFERMFGKRPRTLPLKEPAPGSLGAVNRQLEEIEEWRERVQDILLRHEKELRRLRRDVQVTRYMLDIFLILLLAALSAWWYFFR